MNELTEKHIQMLKGSFFKKKENFKTTIKKLSKR